MKIKFNLQIFLYEITFGIKFQTIIVTDEMSVKY